jgi:PAS domain-containing protein
MDELHAILARKDIDALGRFADTRLYPSIDAITLRLKLLSDLADDQGRRRSARNLRANRRVSALRIGLSLSALIAVALIGRAVLRNAYRGVESLTFLARSMRRHDYTPCRPTSRFGRVGHGHRRLPGDAARRDGFRDRTDRAARAQREGPRELEQRELFQRSLLDAAQVAILAMDREGRWTAFNGSAERMLGWRAEKLWAACRAIRARHDWRRRPADDFPASSERIIAALSQRLGREIRHDWQGMFDMAELRQAPAEARLLHKDGHEIPVLLALAAVHDDQGERVGLIAVATDLTERHRLEADVRASEARAQEANLAKSSFLAAMSHEIRTPMIGVTGMIEILAHSRLDNDQRQRST